MPMPRILIPAFGAAAVLLLMAFGNDGTVANAQFTPKPGTTMVANPITGEGLPNPAPKVTRNWGELPAGRKWGTSAGLDIDPKDGNVWGYERCGAGTAGGGPVDCDNTPVDPIFKFDRRSGKVLANFGKGVMVTPHGIHVDAQGNVWIADFAGNKQGTKGHQVHKFSPKGEKLLSLGIAGKPGNADGQFNQPNDVVTGPDGSIYVSDGHDGQGMTTAQALEEGLKRGATARISKFSPDGKFIKSWGKLGMRHGEFRTPHAMVFDSRGRLWVADRGNHRIEIFDQDGQVPRVALHVRPHQRHLHQGRHGLRDRLGVGPAEPPELARRRPHRPAGRGSHHRVHSAVRARRPYLSGHGGRRHRRRRRRQRLRRGGAELADPGGRRVHEILGEVDERVRLVRRARSLSGAPRRRTGMRRLIAAAALVAAASAQWTQVAAQRTAPPPRANPVIACSSRANPPSRSGQLHRRGQGLSRRRHAAEQPELRLHHLRSRARSAGRRSA